MELYGLVLPHGWLVGVDFSRQYQIGPGLRVWCNVDMYADADQPHPLFAVDDLVSRKMDVSLPNAGPTVGVRYRQRLKRFAQTLRRLGYTLRPHSISDDHFLKVLDNAADLRTAIAEVDALFGSKRKK